MSRALVAIRGVTQRFGTDGAGVAALDGIDLEIPDGQFAAKQFRGPEPDASARV